MGGPKCLSIVARRALEKYRTACPIEALPATSGSFADLA
jgi:hypothetical protein